MILTSWLSKWIAKRGADNYWTLQNEAQGTFFGIEGDVTDDSAVVGIKTATRWFLQQDAVQRDSYRQCPSSSRSSIVSDAVF